MSTWLDPACCAVSMPDKQATMTAGLHYSVAHSILYPTALIAAYSFGKHFLKGFQVLSLHHTNLLLV